MQFEYYKVAIAIHYERDADASEQFLRIMGCSASLNGFGIKATDGEREWSVFHGWLNPAQYEKLPEFIASVGEHRWVATDLRDSVKWNEAISFEEWLLSNGLKLEDVSVA